jgi:hypothetical protein
MGAMPEAGRRAHGRSYRDEAVAGRGGAGEAPYAGLNRIRFEGSVSTAHRRYPRFGRYCTTAAARGQTAAGAAGLTRY